ncbi:hypothetical protein BDP27DRAFT_1328565 [Rhodocollybia butyracea]|uniref:Protection of telomeres protein 1 n=1 Tax=Rhodocollybia butyracea TaxID=206335 RepID=A0A9P5PPD8_9AGAR|nr:hypothetical protein BDP27DRAFT_1328565 [Rhodocollybia butyracea]
MKRRNTDDNTEEPRKRKKTSIPGPGTDLFDFPEHQRYVSSIFHEKLDKKLGYIVGTISIVFSDKGEDLGFVIQAEDSLLGDKTARVEIMFGKCCATKLRNRQVKFSPADKIFLSLQGCTQIKSGKLANAAVGTMRYDERVLMKSVPKGGAREVVVDLWGSKAFQPSTSTDAGWFDPPDDPSGEEPSVKELSKQERRNMRAGLHNEKKKQSKAQIPKASASIQQAVVPPSAQLLAPPKPLTESLEGPLSLQAGCRCDTLHLASLEEAKSKGSHTIAAVVYADSAITTTVTGDDTITLQLVDPSNRKLSDNSHCLNYSMKAIFFAKSQPDQLPHSQVDGVNAGDIVVLSDVKTRDYNGGTNLTGFKNSFKWAIFDLNCNLTHGTNVPRDASAIQRTLFKRNDQKLLDYCSKLREWWKAIEQKRKEVQGEVHQVVTPPPERTARPFLLIKDATPHTLSNGYFNCIAEIVHKHKPDQACYSLYVTDYTSNESAPTYEADWCPPGLSQSILRVELWDQSYSLGERMEVGEIYSFKNIRMRSANNGTYEAKMQEKKISKLDPSYASGNIAFQGFLERKTKWAAKHKIEEQVVQLKFRRIEEICLKDRFNCIMEILYVLPNSSGVNVYATDYTSNELLPDPDLEFASFDHLDQRVFKVVLRDSQAERGKNLIPGDICVFQKVVFKCMEQQNEKLVKLLDPKAPNHKKLMGDLEIRKIKLLGKKSPFTSPPPTQSESGSRSGSPCKPETASTAPVPRPETSNRSSASAPRAGRLCTSVSQLESCDASIVPFQIFARAIFIKPLKLQDYARAFCDNCKRFIPARQKACVLCDDTDHDFVHYKYQFNVWIVEDEGEHPGMPLEVYDDALFLKDMPRVNLSQNPKALKMFQQWFETFAGNLLEYQADRLKEVEARELKSPLIGFEGYRYVREEDGKQICRLISCKHPDP